jgi:hypothetical protein
VRDAKDYSRYAYAFWESIDGAFGKLSLLSGAEAIARFCRELEERICAIALLIARYTIFTIKHPARTARRSVHGLIKKEP